MHRKILMGLCALFLAAIVLVGGARAAAVDNSTLALRIAGQIGADAPAQIRFVTPTPTPVNLDDNPQPIRSEAGRDVGLIIGAAFLVLIVIGGVIFGLRWRPKPKARD